MKKKFLLLALIIAVTQLAKAQVNTVAGSVKDEKGNPLHFVFVGDSQYRNATFSDSFFWFDFDQISAAVIGSSASRLPCAAAAKDSAMPVAWSAPTMRRRPASQWLTSVAATPRKPTMG